MATRSSEQDGDGDDTDGEFRLPAIEGIEFVNYVDEEQLDDVMRLVGQDLSEPYSGELTRHDCTNFYCAMN